MSRGTRRKFGTILVRRKDGRVQAVIGRYTYRRVRVQRSFGPQGRGEAKAWLEQERMLVDLDRRGVLEWRPPRERERQRAISRITFAEYADGWLHARRRKDGGRLQGSTKRNIRAIVRHLKDAFPEPLLLTDLTARRIQEWYDGPHPEGQWTFIRCCEKLRAMLKDAASEGPDGQPPLLDHSPFALPIPADPDIPRHELPPVSGTELAGLYLAMPDYTRISVLIAAVCGGLRIGELCALTVGDFDLERRLLHIRRSAVRDENDLGPSRRGKTKSQRSRRTVILPETLIPLIRKHIGLWCDTREDAPFLVPKRGGECLCRNTLGKHILIARKTISRDDVTFHTLRATQATVMIALGGTPREAADQLGHKDSTVTMTYYQRVIPDHHRDVVRKTADALLGTASEMGLLDPDAPEPGLDEWETLRDREAPSARPEAEPGSSEAMCRILADLSTQIGRLTDLLERQQKTVRQ